MKLELIDVPHPIVLPFVWFCPFRRDSLCRYYQDQPFGRFFWDWQHRN